MLSKEKSALIVRGTPLGGERVADVAVRNGRVVAVKCAGTGRYDVGSQATILAPTLFDIQVNGYGGIKLGDEKLKPEDVRTITDALAAQGVSHWIPTLITGSEKSMIHGCRVLAEARQDHVVRHAVPGIHLEGPFISPEDGPRGAHPKRHVRLPSLREFDQYMKAAEGHILYITLAPELKGAIPFIRAMRKRHITVSLGHHYADAETIAKAVDAGARLCTHLGNGMKPEIPRHDNPLWPQLAEDRLIASLIPDLHHLPAPALKTFVRAKGLGGVIFTSDIVHVAGLKPGKYEMGHAEVQLLPTGKVCLSGTKLLAGSAVPLLQGLVNASRTTDLSLEDAFTCATDIPASLFGLRRRFDPPRAGRPADFVAFEIDKTQPLHRAVIHASFVNGRRMA